jgi:hypothetical protein
MSAMLRTMTMRQTAMGIGIMLLACSACTGSEANGRQSAPPTDAPSGDTAVWNADATRAPIATASSFTALVERLGCANGETGKVLPPAVTEGDDEVVVTFTVEPIGSGPALCPGNKPVPYTVTLSKALGKRRIVDGSCLAGAAAATTTHCTGGGQRWPRLSRG